MASSVDINKHHENQQNLENNLASNIMAAADGITILDASTTAETAMRKSA